MASITIKNIPEDVHRRLKQVAKHGGRSLNQEIVQQLRDAVAGVRTPEEVEQEMASIRRHAQQRAAHGYKSPSAAEIVKIIRDGRERR